MSQGSPGNGSDYYFIFETDQALNLGKGKVGMCLASLVYQFRDQPGKGQGQWR